MDVKRHLLIDTETFSSADLSKTGVFRYVEAEDFEILLLAYAWDREPVQIIDLTDPMKRSDDLADIMEAIMDPKVVKVAHNCAFERACLSKHLGHYLPPEEWEDTMVMCAYNGLPMSLDAAGAALQLKDQKIKEGTTLISYFCKPCKPTTSNRGRERNMPWHAPDKWERFCEYCRRDVEVEQAIYYRLSSYEVTPMERQVFCLDARINERGVLLDMDMVRAAQDVDAAVSAEQEAELRRLTGLDNPNSVSQLKTWLEGLGHYTEKLDKAAVADLLTEVKDPTVRRVLELRQQLGKTSTTKYEAMSRAVCSDNRVRGLLQYYGAGRSGRWAGRIVQVQNLPQNHLDNIGTVRELVKQRDTETLELAFDSVPDVLSQLIRTAFVAKEGHTFLVADYAAIEARIISHLSGCQWRQDVFRDGGDIYCSSASAMFKVPVVKHGVNGHLRQKGKIAELACGYGGGVNALKAFGADKMGLSDQEMQEIVTQWRAASPEIPQLWRDVESAAKRAINHPGLKCACRAAVYRMDKDALRCTLSSGRVLSYWGAGFDNDGGIYYWGQNQTTRKWERIGTWGGKLVENIVQAFARDCLAVAMLRLEAEGWRICFHVHDEVIVEAPEGSRWEDVAEVMGRPLKWATGLLLRGDGYETKFYMKD